MKKYLAKICVAILIFTTLSNTSFAAFSDLFSSHPNYNAITFLQENGFLNGYDDGTFRPDITVNRAEFLTIILKGSNIPLDVTAETPFPDVNHNAWYGRYVKKAYAEGWIDGYDDHSFKPDQTINKAEALKIIGKVQNWQPAKPETAPFDDVSANLWFAPYVAYAKDHYFLEEQGDNFDASDFMTRAKVSEIIYRTIIFESEIIPDEEPDETTDDEESEEPKTPDEEETPDEPTPEINFTPHAYQNISAGFYDDIRLSESFPNTFYQNEIYIFKGEITESGHEIATVILEGETTSSYETFDDEAINNEFEIAVHFRSPGNYNLGLLPGTNGESRAIEISVLPDLPENSQNIAGDAPQNLDIYFENNETKASISEADNTLKKFIFTQGTKEVTYLNRQNINEFPIQYRDFENFKENSEVTLTVELASLNSQKPLSINSDFGPQEEITFTPEIHQYAEFNTAEISGSPPETLSSPRQINFTGTALKDLRLNAYVLKPDGFVDQFNLSTNRVTETYGGSEIITAGSTFTFTYNFTGTGTYIIEINNKSGVAAINQPIYIGSKIPLLPDFFDINDREFENGTISLSVMQEELLNYINASRAEHGLSSVTLSSELNELAQLHSDDMAQNNFFDHVNPEGMTPDDRRISLGITTPVGENLAQDVSIKFAHEGLMRSAAHRANILDQDWTRVGIGITKNDGYLYITEEFSTDILTEQDLSTHKNELLESINDLRESAAVSALNYDLDLSSASDYLNNKQIEENIALSNGSLVEALELYNIEGTTQALGRTYISWSEILSSILNDEEDLIKNPLWEKIGIDVALDSLGSIYTIILLNY